VAAKIMAVVRVGPGNRTAQYGPLHVIIATL
jgi:hypothetical protein